MLHRTGYLLVVLLGLACAIPKSWAEFKVNTFTTNNQTGPSVAKLSAGRSVVVWTSAGQDISGSGIFGQRYDSTGVATGGEFRVNTHVLGSQSDPSVAGLTNGGFVVVWTSSGQDGSFGGIYGQRYDSLGVRVGTEFQVNTTVLGNQTAPSVAGLSQGGFVVAWTSLPSSGPADVLGQRYDAAGMRLGSQFRAHTTFLNHQMGPAVAGLNDSTFVITWESFGQDGSGWGVYGQRYSPTGAKKGPEFQINTATAGDQRSPSIAALSNGTFIVVWTSAGQDGSLGGVYGQRFTANAVRDGNEFRVNTTTTGNQNSPSVAALSSGRFVVTWVSDGQDGSSGGVYGQRFSATGNGIGGEFAVNTTTAGNQNSPSIAAQNSGGFFVTWTSAGQDGSGDGVYAERFTQ